MSHALRWRTPVHRVRPKRGIIVVASAATLVVVFAFVAFAIDSGRISKTQTTLQNAVDAAALAASQEIVSAVYVAGQNQSTANLDSNSISIANARAMAVTVAAANGVTINSATDVTFGKRVYNPNDGTWTITWGGTPYNVVKVSARRTDADTSSATGRLPLAFGWAVGQRSVALAASATAFVEARDIVLVLDYSSSMNDDSSIGAFNSLGRANVEANLDEIWQALVDAAPKFSGTSKLKFPASGFGSLNSAAGTYVSSTNSDTVFTTLGLGATGSGGALLYPFPQAGKTGTAENGMPSATTSKAKWKAYIDYVKNHSNSTYRRKYGYRTLMDYLLENSFKNTDSEDLWRTPHYPFHAMKDGATLFTQFLTNLNFGDELGLVVFDSSPHREYKFTEYGYNIDLTANPITSDYSAINTIQRHRQAGHYDSSTGMGDGIDEGRDLLVEKARFGARKTMLVMTDGITNRRPSGWSLPASFKWSKWTDYDGDGNADYSTSDANVQYAFYQATQAIQAGITIHTMSVGVDADDNVMKAIAFAAGGIWIDVPGGVQVSTMQSQMQAAFSKIAAKVPPPKLVYDNSN